METIFSSVSLMTSMTQNAFLVAAVTIFFGGSIFFRSLINWLRRLRKLNGKIVRFMHSPIAKITDDELFNEEEEEEDGGVYVEECKYCNKQIGSHDQAVLNCDDIEVVLKKLGIHSFDKGKCRDRVHFEHACDFLENKEATLEELKEAFAVFDENRDGFISAAELQRIMSKLDFEEGMKLEDCDKMIGAFDKNGDHRIDFSEFKNMLEN